MGFDEVCINMDSDLLKETNNLGLPVNHFETPGNTPPIEREIRQIMNE